MTIFGPLVAPRTSTVTPALSSPVAVTWSPSTVITTGSVSVSPTAASVLSISMTSPTATFCCRLPARTIAYTAVSFIVSDLALVPPDIVARRAGAIGGDRTDTARSGERAPRVHGTGGPHAGQNGNVLLSAQRFRPFRLTGTCRAGVSSTGCSIGTSTTASPAPDPWADAGGPAGRLAERRRVRVTT